MVARHSSNILSTSAFNNNQTHCLMPPAISAELFCPESRFLQTDRELIVSSIWKGANSFQRSNCFTPLRFLGTAFRVRYRHAQADRAIVHVPGGTRAVKEITLLLAFAQEILSITRCSGDVFSVVRRQSFRSFEDQPEAS